MAQCTVEAVNTSEKRNVPQHQERDLDLLKYLVKFSIAKYRSTDTILHAGF